MRNTLWMIVAAVGMGMVLFGTSSEGVEPVELASLRTTGSSSSRLTPESRKAIDRGFDWLLSAMRHDGSFGTDIGHRPDLACTAMVGLALLSEGNTPVAGPHHKELSRVLDAVLYMLSKVPGGDDPNREVTLVQRKIGRNADLFISALFLSQVLGEAPGYEKDVRAALERLVEIICTSQRADGTWGDESWAPVLGTVLGWESLRAASSSGLKVNASARLAGEALLKALKNQPNDPDNWMHNFYKQASSIRVLYSMGYREDTTFLECVKRILSIAETDARVFDQAGGEEYLAFFLVTECLLKEPDEKWIKWYPIVAQRMVRVQNADGSWSGHHCITSRTFCTAAALLTLQAQNLYLPVSDL